ncbi:MAG TPA: hypothetical protein VGR32_06730 [Brevundimonas sp.]|jgi:hypothetical protein|uniref:hypothetical protein n=1 Tax=Brevundimonas sp. TaxID=1871086 RepID=UPI002DEFD71E|nr:hypothetical protein [Brevundimonas sp.]
MKAIVRDRGVRLVAGLFLLSCAGSGWLAWHLSPMSNGTDQARYERFFEAR